MRRAFAYEPVDRLPLQANYTKPMADALAAHFGVEAAALPDVLDNHLLRLDISHARRLSDDHRVSYDWWGAGWSTETEGYWHVAAPLSIRDSLDAYPWPDPREPELLDGARVAVRANPGERFVVPNLGICLFERAWSLRGFETLLMDLCERPQWVEELLDRIVEIQLVLVRRFLDLGVDGGYFGDDYGAQRGMIFSPRIWRQLFKPRLARLIQPFRDAGLPVMLHSDGDIKAILPDLVEIGVTVLNPVQPEILDHEWLRREYGRRLAFYGGLSTQEVLPRYTPAEVRAATAESLRKLAPDGTGALFGPSHRMQSDIPPQNVAAMLEEVRPS